MVWCSLEELSVSVGLGDFVLKSSVLTSILDGWSGGGNEVVSGLGLFFLDSGSCAGCLAWFPDAILIFYYFSLFLIVVHRRLFLDQMRGKSSFTSNLDHSMCSVAEVSPHR